MIAAAAAGSRRLAALETPLSPTQPSLRSPALCGVAVAKLVRLIRFWFSSNPATFRLLRLGTRAAPASPQRQELTAPYPPTG
jgi:hypothetical protein